MDYAKKLLGKYGWKEGDSLGKDNNGISKPIKANLKFDNAGLGFDRGEEFKNHWWKRVYNEAANNIIVEDNDGDLSVRVKDVNAVEISTKDYNVSKLKRSKQVANEYNHFRKIAKLNGFKETRENNTNSQEDAEIVPAPQVLTDEELYKVCGGRTAHKGARHGLSQKGKLSRIEEQDQLLLLKMRNRSEEFFKTNKKEDEDENVWKIVSKKKKKPSRNDTELANSKESNCSEMNGERQVETKSEISVENTVLENDTISEQKSKRKNSTVSSTIFIEESECSQSKKKREKKRKREELEEEDTAADFLKTEENNSKKQISKKKMKKLMKHAAEDLQNELNLE